ncbi:MAG: hypothetical protein HKUEN02_10560 [Anaerolineaceae bacterium]|nr:MAG: hypothetical protein HKUEN02_10560 [Anaerolineaceae bacterium]
MNSFIVNDAVAFKLVRQDKNKNAKAQVFFGVLFGVLLRWIYTMAVEVIKGSATWDFGAWAVVAARFVAALATTIFVFSGYWEKSKDQPADMRFLNALAFGISIDMLVAPWMS